MHTYYIDVIDLQEQRSQGSPDLNGRTDCLTLYQPPPRFPGNIVVYKSLSKKRSVIQFCNQTWH